MRPRHIHVKKYFIEVRFPSPAEKINNMGVEAAAAGLFPEARNLFLEALTEMPESAAPRNNLGVIYELFGDREKAFAMYSEAFMLDPGSSIVRGNYLSFEETSTR
jgi:Flp pilus assembly protein TadD